LSGYEVCAKRTIGCTDACLNLAGRGGMFKRGETTNVIQQARIRKTKLFFEDRAQFMRLLVADIELAIKQSIKKGFTPVFRLNGTSDINWTSVKVVRKSITYDNIFLAFSECQFYDYTAVVKRLKSEYKIANYHLTFSAKESNDLDIAKAIEFGANVAVVFNLKKGLPMPTHFNGVEVYNGDQSDTRFLDPKGVIVGLYLKGKSELKNFAIKIGFAKSPYKSILIQPVL
jgi:hypothetical protein